MVRVVGPRTGFWVVLNGKNWPRLVLESSHGAVIDMPMGNGASGRIQRGCFNAKTVILARNLNPIPTSGMNGLICSAMTKLHFGRFGPQSET